MFCAVFASVVQGARTRETIALKAGGVNPVRAWLPVIGLALGVGLALGLLQETAGVRAAAALSERAGVSRGELTRSGRIWYHAGPVVYSAREADADGERVADVLVLERDEQGRLLRQVQAERAQRLDPAQWSFENVVVRSYDPNDPAAPPRIERAAARTLSLATDRTPRLHPDELATLSLPTLAAYIGAVQKSGGSLGPARFAFHQRASAPLVALLFALLAVPLGLAVEGASSVALRALQGVLWIAGFLLLRDAAAGIAHPGGPAALLLPWGLLALFLAIATFRLTRAPR